MPVWLLGIFIAHGLNNKIILMILTPHSSHLTQSLDIGVFFPLKTAMSAELDPLIRTDVNWIHKAE